MAFDSTTFASEFTDMFGAFARQQEELNEKLITTIEDLGITLAEIIGDAAKNKTGKAKSVKDKAVDYANEAQEKYLGGRPKTGPRMVKKASIGVVIDDISKKAVYKLKGEETVADEESEEPPKTKMGLLALLGGILGAGAVAVIGKVFGAGAGAGVAAGLLAKIGPLIFKPLKVILKRLPIIGSLFSFYEAYEHFKLGGVDNIILGLLDVAAGFAYAFPGVGTAIGLGIDVLSYFINKRVEEHKEGGSDTSFFGSLYDKVIEYLSETDTIKWMVTLGDLFGEIWDDPTNLDTWKNFATHLGGPVVALIEMLSNFSTKAGAALGLKSKEGKEIGLASKLMEMVNTYVIDPLVEMIKGVFKYVKDAVMSAAEKVTGTAKKIFGYTPAGWIAGKIKDKLVERKVDPEDQESREQILSEIKGSLSDLFPGNEDWKKASKEAALEAAGKMSLEELMQQNNRLKKELGMPLDDFAVINGEMVSLPKTAIVSSGRVQAFSGEDTVIGFKEGEALLEGITNLISVGREQLLVLEKYLTKSDNNNILAPSTNNNSTYNFSVESGVTSFRKMVS